jgi:hypothetical protein
LSIATAFVFTKPFHYASALNFEAGFLSDTSDNSDRILENFLDLPPKILPPILETTFPITPHMTWDSFQRLSYESANQKIQMRANTLIENGDITYNRVKDLVEVQRNNLVIKTRNRLSPFGKLYSEILKPRTQLPTLDTMLERKGTLENVLKSVGKSRAAVDSFSSVFRKFGSCTIAIQMILSGLKLSKISSQERNRVASGEAGKLIAGTAGGMGGAWAGCAAGAAIASPTLVLPVIGEVTTGGACMAGGFIGGIGASSVLSEAGKAISLTSYDQIKQMGKKHHSGQGVSL